MLHRLPHETHHSSVKFLKLIRLDESRERVKNNAHRVRIISKENYKMARRLMEGVADTLYFNKNNNQNN